MKPKELALIVKATVREFSKDDVPFVAAGLTYYIFLSIFPALLFLATLAGFFFGDMEETESFVFDTLKVASYAPGAAKLFEDIIRETYNNRDQAGLVFLISLGILIYSASNAFSTLDRAINRVWGAEKIPTFIVGKIVAFTMMLIVAGILSLAAMFSVALASLRTLTEQMVGETPVAQTLWLLADITASQGVVFLVFLLMYRFLPRCDLGFRDVWLSALLAAAAWVLSKVLFAMFLANFANFDAVYGSIGTVIVLLTWIYISSVVILTGAEFAAEANYVRSMSEQVGGENNESGPDKGTADGRRQTADGN